jgi:hypothetical protein
MADRRVFLMMLLLGLAAPGIPQAFAKDGDGGGGGGGGDGGGDGGGGNSGHGGGDDDDGGGGDNSGHGGGDDRDDDDRDDDDRDDDRDRDEDESEKEDDDDKIRAAVNRGDAEPLRNILSIVRRRYKGDVVRIRLTGRGTNMLYRIRLIDPKNKLIEVRVNARTARIVGAAGF